MNLLLVVSFAAVFPMQQQPVARPKNIRDSTIMVVAGVGQRVAEVRSNLEHLRMLLVTDSLASGAHTEAAEALKAACDSLAALATRGRRIMCPRCMAAPLRASLAGYRDYLPSVAAMARRASARMDRVPVATASPRVKRQLALDLSTIFVTGLRPYERHINDVIRAMRAPARRGP